MDRGHHPFDYGDAGTNRSVSDKDMEELASWEEKMSLSYVRNDRKVRKRIIDDAVEFEPSVWGSLNDGTHNGNSALDILTAW